MKAKASDAAYWRSILEGVKSKGVQEIIDDDRGYWYDRRRQLSRIHTRIDWEYEYGR